MGDIRMGIREIWWEDTEWTHLAQNGGQWRALVNTIMNPRIPQKAGNFLTN